MEIEKTFCQGCKQRIRESTIFNKTGVIEFEDGFYCDKCAKIKVDAGRKS